MAGYNLFLTNGELLTTIDQKTIDLRTSSFLVLIANGDVSGPVGN